MSHYVELARVVAKEKTAEAIHRHPATWDQPRDQRTVVIRPAGPADAAALATLAILDEESPLSDPALVAETDGRVVAAMGLVSGRILTDPFARVTEVKDLLRLRARQLTGGNGRSRLSLRRA